VIDAVNDLVGLIDSRVYGECQWVVRVQTKPTTCPVAAKHRVRTERGRLVELFA
jgi:hypothetical protein